MKIIGKRRSGKTTFLFGFLLSLVNNSIIKDTDIWIFCPTFNCQSQWSDTIFKPENIDHLRIDEQSHDKLLVFDDMQTDLKHNNILTEMFTKERYYGIGIIQ